MVPDAAVCGLCRGAMLPSGGGLYRCEICAQEVPVGATGPALIDELSARNVLTRAALDPRAFVEGAIAGRDLLVSACAACGKEGIWNPLGVKSSEGMPSGLSHTICPFHMDVMRFEDGRPPEACWYCSPDPRYSSAPWGRCASCTARDEEGKRRAAQAKADELAAAAAKEQARHEDDMRSVDGYLKDRRRAEFEKNLDKSWRG